MRGIEDPVAGRAQQSLFIQIPNKSNLQPLSAQIQLTANSPVRFGLVA